MADETWNITRELPDGTPMRVVYRFEVAGRDGNWITLAPEHDAILYPGEHVTITAARTVTLS